MVMFKEDEEKMIAEERARRRKNPWWRLFKVMMVLSLFVLIFLWVLASIGGSSDTLKKGVEEYLGSVSGYDTTVENFDHLKFFPNLSLKAANIVFRDGSNVTGGVKLLDFSVPFWSVILKRPRFNHLNVEDLVVLKAATKDQDFAVEKIVLDEKEKKPVLAVSGRYGDAPFDATFFLQKDKKDRFYLDDKSPYVVQTNSLNVNGHVHHKKGAVFGDLAIEGHSKLMFELGLNEDLQGQIKTDRSLIEFDIAGGEVIAPFLDIDDISLIVTYLGEVLVFLPATPEDTVYSLPEKNYDFVININELRAKDQAIGHFVLPVKLDNGILNAGPLSGEFSGGNLSGQFDLVTLKDKPSALSLKFGLEKWDYGQIQKAYYGRENVKGRADIVAGLTSEGVTKTDLIEGLKGDIAFIAGRGEMRTKAFNIWGAGLVNSMLPSLDPDSEAVLNCAIAGFKVENSIATASPVFIDTKRVTVAGEGSINLADMQIDMGLKPKAKAAALIDVSTPVKISGSVASPKISVDAAGLGLTIGSALLGIVNPASLLLTMTDLGLTENHPCREFVQ